MVTNQLRVIDIPIIYVFPLVGKIYIYTLLRYENGNWFVVNVQTEILSFIHLLLFIYSFIKRGMNNNNEKTRGKWTKREEEEDEENEKDELNEEKK